MFRSSFRCLKILGAGLLVLFSTHLSALTIDTTSRSAVTTAYDTYLSAFNVPSGWTGNVANCDAGTTSPEYQQATIDTINFYRAMAAGVYSYSFGPVNLVTDDTINRRARQAALYMAANGTQSLSPPAGNCYNASTSADIIAGIGASMLSFGHPASSFAGPGAIAQYMNDAGNEATLAYRRALLYSQQIGIATGDIVDDSAPSSYSANALRFKPAPGEQSNLFTAVSIYASSFITAWPNANFIPYPLVPSSGFWSFSIQQSPFNIDSNTVVTMARSDGTPVPIAKAVALPTGYGDATLLFEPVGLSFAAGMADTSYKITVSFLMSAGGSYSYYNSQCYTVTVFDPAQSSGNDVAPNLCYNTDDAQTPYVSTVQSQNITYAQNALATPISVNADVSDGGTLSYQWYSNTANSVYGGTPIGTNDPTYTPNTANVGTLYYYVVVTNTNPAATGAKTASATFMVAGVSVIASLGSNTIDLSLANPPASGTGWTYSESVNTSSGMDGVYTILDGANVLVINNCYYDSTSTTYSSRHFEVEAAATATITLNNMSIGGAGCSSASSALLLDAGADVTLILADDSTNTMGAGIQTTGAKLTINGEAKSTGVLTVNSFSTGAAIGGGTGVYDPISTTFIPGSGDGGTLIINGGTINAVGGYYGAGIGGGYGAGGNITINGGTVNATSSSMDSGGAGIGGGYGSMVNSDGGAITINDGTVNARGCGGAGIGGGSGIGSASGSITINGGNITVGNSSNLTGSACASSYKGNGIGSGGNSYSTSSTSGSITINGGTIYALGQNAGIGSSLGNETITITGGTITAIGSGGAGIGNGYTYDYSASPPTYTGVNNIIISGGMITAIGSSGAGIGGAGNTYDGGNITITGGTITAISNLGQGAGIGDAGPTGNGSNIIISGGAIFAYAGDNSGYGYGAGIGGGNSYGSNGNIGNILIYGENTFVTAQGGSDGGQDIGIGYCSSDPCPVDNVFVALPKGNLKNASGVIGNDVLFTATPKSVAGIVETTLPPPFDAAPFPGVNGVYDLMTGLDPTGKTFSVITTYGSSDPIPFALSGYSVTPDPATGSYLLGTGATVIFSAPSGTPLTFTYDPSFDIPASTVGTPITDIDVSGGVSGGAQPYTFSATGLPDGISISTTGVISGTPTTATPCATSCTATLTVTDDVNATASITINYGTITPAGSGSTYAITLAPPGPYDFGSLDAGYASTALLPQTVTVTNSGD
ncbi:MAG: hypothetical protein FWF41_06730, partial [Betaproteobacteria bacterium]|nr:hypothetical protein [Betaproteobacteria bacterium]